MSIQLSRSGAREASPIAPAPTVPALDLSRHPEAQTLNVRPHDLETNDELAPTTTSSDSLHAQLEQIGSQIVVDALDDFLPLPSRRPSKNLRSLKTANS